MTPDARKGKTAKELSRNALPKSRCLRPLSAKKRSSNSKCSWTAETKRKSVLQSQRPQPVKLLTLTPKASNGNGRFLSPAPLPARTECKTDQQTNKRIPKNPRRNMVAQFRFQTFKKCFYGKCSTVLVPGDFRPCSPRRMFCSQECFETHWKEKLYAHGPALDRKAGNAAKAGFPQWKPVSNGKKPKKAHRVSRAIPVAQFPLSQKTENGRRNQGLMRAAAGF